MTIEIDLSGRVALIGGAARNIGRATALEFARAGATVLCGWHSTESSVSETCAQIIAEGGRAEPLPVDYDDVAGLRASAASALASHGVVDVVVHVPAIRHARSLFEVSESDWDAVMSTNVRGQFFLSQALIPPMRKRGWGRLIFFGGTGMYLGHIGRVHTMTSKAAVVGLSRALAAETARWGITVNAVHPGGTATTRDPNDLEIGTKLSHAVERIPIGRLGKAEELAQTCVFLASEAGAYITGQEIFVSGGSYPLIRQMEDEVD